MRILQIIGTMDQACGGPPRSVQGLSQALAQAGHEVVIVARGAEGWRPEQLHATFPGGGTLRLVEPASGQSLLTVGREMLPGTAIAHFHSVWQPSFPSLAAMARRQGIPTVFAPRGDLAVWAMRQKTLKKKIYLALVGRRMIRQAGMLHLLNDQELSGVCQLNLSGRYVIVPNGVDTSELDALPPPGRFRELHPEVGNRTLIVFLARYHKVKGGDLLAQAFVDLRTAHPDTCLVMAGADGGHKARILSILQKGSATDQALLLDFVTGEERAALMQDATIVALPSHREGHPRTVIESAYLGKTLLITPPCNCPELPAGEAAEVVADTLEGVQEGLARLLADGAYRERLSARAREIARDYYPWPQVAARMLRYYDILRTNPDSLPDLVEARQRARTSSPGEPA